MNFKTMQHLPISKSAARIVENTRTVNSGQKQLCMHRVFCDNDIGVTATVAAMFCKQWLFGESFDMYRLM